MAVKGERISIYFSVKELEVYKHVKNVSNSSNYIIDLIKKDMMDSQDSIVELRQQVELLSSMVLSQGTLQNVQPLITPVQNPSPPKSPSKLETTVEITENKEIDSETIEEKSFEIDLNGLDDL